ncbi:MAG: hypothetical protein M0P71_17905 [Melioribacteraceae bacterium]|nr:hypothetical protein [Melioribacteraceae bacterium]
MNEEEKNIDPVKSRYKNFSGEKKLQIAMELYNTAWELKRVSIKHFYPELSDKEVEDKVREIFLYARS